MARARVSADPRRHWGTGEAARRGREQGRLSPQREGLSNAGLRQAALRVEVLRRRRQSSPDNDQDGTPVGAFRG